VVDLTSDEKDNTLPDTSRDEEFTRRLFGNLNRGLLRPPSDDNDIILSNSNEEEEAREETASDTYVAPSSVVRFPAPIASTADTDEDPKGMQDDNSGVLAPDREIGDRSSGEMKLAHLRLSCQEWRLRQACFKELRDSHGPALLLHKLFCAYEWGW
jgi:hypothetical protein